jgi:hypothetical protein
MMMMTTTTGTLVFVLQAGDRRQRLQGLAEELILESHKREGCEVGYRHRNAPNEVVCRQLNGPVATVGRKRHRHNHANAHT